MRRWLPAGLTAAGFVVMLVAGFASGPYRPNPFDVDDPLPCRCSAAEAAAVLSGLWWWVAAGAVLATAGIAVHVVTRSAARAAPPSRSLPAPLHALVVAVAGALAFPVLGFAVLVALIGTPHLLPPALGVVLLVQAVLLAALESAIGAVEVGPRRALLTGLVAAPLASAVSGSVFLRFTPDALWWVAALHGALLGLAVLVSRIVVSRTAVRSRAHDVLAAG